MRKVLLKLTIQLVAAFLILSTSSKLEARAQIPCGSHLITEADDDGLVTLEDGSEWKVAYKDTDELYSWCTQCELVPVTLTPNYFAFNHAYYFTNQLTGSYIRANLVGAPVRGSRYAITIEGLELSPYRDAGIYLSDGTFWRVSSLDSDEVRNWYIDDLVILGKNTEWFSFSTHILINIHTNTFVRASRI